MKSASQGLNLMHLCICLDGFVKNTGSLCAPHPVAIEQQGASDTFTSLALAFFTPSFNVFYTFLLLPVFLVSF